MLDYSAALAFEERIYVGYGKDISSAIRIFGGTNFQIYLVLSGYIPG